MTTVSVYYILIWSISIGLYFLPPSAVYSTRTSIVKNITIGVLISMSGPKRVGLEAVAAINMTFDFLKTSPDFEFLRNEGYQFQALLDDVPCEPSDAFAEMMDIFSTSGEHMHGAIQNAFVGPGCDEICQTGGQLSKYYDVMIMSYGCESTIFDIKHDFPTFGRTAPNARDIQSFFVKIISHFQWPRVTLVTIATSFWQGMLSEFETAISDTGVTVRFLSIESVKSMAESDFEMHLNLESLHSMDAVYEFMKQVGRKDLLNGEHAFLSFDFAGTHSFAELNNATFLDGLLDVTFDVRPETKEYQEFLENLLHMSQIDVNTKCSNYEYGIHPLLISDGIFVMASALNNSIAWGIPIGKVTEIGHCDIYNDASGLFRNGVVTSNLIYNQTFQGLIHEISLDEIGTRVSRLMLHNIQNGCYVPVARSNEYHNVEPSLTFLGNPIIWPGGTTVAPLGRGRCGWNNEFCPAEEDKSAIITGSTIGSVLMLSLLAIAALIYILWRRNTKQSLLLSTSWLIEWEDIKWRLLDVNSSTQEPSTTRPGPPSNTYVGSRSQTSLNADLMSKCTEKVHYKCQVVRVDQDVVWACKNINKHNIHLSEAVRKELNLIRALKHANVNSFMGACIKHGHVSVMWSYCPKGSLQDFIHSGMFKMEIMFQLSFAQDIAKGLAYLHNSELTVHGRLKSSNIIIDSGLNCKLTDIDMPKFRDGEIIKGAETEPEYWFQHVWTSPERLRSTNHTVCQKCDIYAYSIVLFEIMFKRKPYFTDEHVRTNTEPNWKDIISFVKDPSKVFEIEARSKDSIYTITEDEDKIVEEDMFQSTPFTNYYKKKVKNAISDMATMSQTSTALKFLQCDKDRKHNAVLPVTCSKGNEYSTHGSSCAINGEIEDDNRSSCICCKTNTITPQRESLEKTILSMTASIRINEPTKSQPSLSYNLSSRCFRPEIPLLNGVSCTASVPKSLEARSVLLSSFSIKKEVLVKKNTDNEIELIQLMTQCWDENPSTRPTAESIVRRLRACTNGRSLSDNIEQILTRYSEQLENTVKERTQRLEEEKAKYFHVLCEVIPQKYVGTLVSGSKVEAEWFSHVTVFFSDIVGFTTICGKCSPKEVLDFLNELYTSFDVVLNSYNVYKVETIGDAYMVAAGIPEPVSDHAQQIANMALHLLSVSAYVKVPGDDKDDLKKRKSIKLRIGLNSGPVVAGIVGEKMPRYCLFGNTVNIASRMESTGKPFKIHLSKETYNELEAIGGFKMAYRGLTSVKGKENPVPTYWLINSIQEPLNLPEGSSSDED